MLHMALSHSILAAARHRSRSTHADLGASCTDAPSKLDQLNVTVNGVARRAPTVAAGNLLDLKINGGIPDGGMTMCIDTTGK
jgi:hypothetical protein